MITHYATILSRTIVDINITMKGLHGYFRQVRAHPIAVRGNNIRVFGTETELTELLDDLHEHLERSGVKYESPNTIPTTITKWSRFRKFRIPTRKSDRNNSDLRFKRMRLADELPYFDITSRSSKSSFRLYYELTQYDAPMTGECLPDTYGLSVTSRPFTVPHFE